jgi:hypothetical protein
MKSMFQQHEDSLTVNSQFYGNGKPHQKLHNQQHNQHLSSLTFYNCSSFVAGDKNADPGRSSIPGLLGPAYHHASRHQVQPTFIYAHSIHTPCNFQPLTFHPCLHESFHLFIYVQKFSPVLTTSTRKDGVQEKEATWQWQQNWSWLTVQNQQDPAQYSHNARVQNQTWAHLNFLQHYQLSH